jgi:plasmid stability protein
MAPMKTLYVRNVPDEVAERLERLAAREGMSVNAFVVRELAETARRADNAALLADLQDHDVSMDEIVAIIREMRGD